MKLLELTQRFNQIVAPDIPNEWDVEEMMEPYLEQSDEVCQTIFWCIPAIWPISNALCRDFLKLLPELLGFIPLTQLPALMGEILDCYEMQGLRAAQQFMRGMEGRYLERNNGAGLVLLGEVEGRLLPFIRGVGGRDLMITSGNAVFTDTETIFLPPELAIYP